MYNVSVDLDNVLKDLVGSVIRFAWVQYGVTLEREVDFSKWDKAIGYKLGLSHEEYLVWAWKNQIIHWGAEPVPGAAEAMEKLCARYNVTILTATEFPDLVAPWCERWCIPYHSLRFAKDKSQEPFDVLIDDSPTTLKTLHQGGREVIRFAWPWNRELDSLGLPTIHNWNEIDECLTRVGTAQRRSV